MRAGLQPGEKAMNHNGDAEIGKTGESCQPTRKPSWLRSSLPTGEAYQAMKQLTGKLNLHTVCESACCPNRGECWSRSTATFMILGNICTRSCGFCNVVTGRPQTVDLDEPRRVAHAIESMQLRHAVITSVNRDELADGGAAVWSETINQVRKRCPQTKIEVLIPDFCGDWDALQQVLEARPDILNHNVETVPKLYKTVRPQGRFERSIELLRRAGEFGLTTKSGLMVGLGESDDEVVAVLSRLKAVSCNLVTIGQYMQPTASHLPVVRWVPPDVFSWYREQGIALGLAHVFSGPLVRSSYQAEEQASQATAVSPGSVV